MGTEVVSRSHRRREGRREQRQESKNWQCDTFSVSHIPRQGGERVTRLVWRAGRTWCEERGEGLQRADGSASSGCACGRTGLNWKARVWSLELAVPESESSAATWTRRLKVKCNQRPNSWQPKKILTYCLNSRGPHRLKHCYRSGSSNLMDIAIT